MCSIFLLSSYGVFSRGAQLFALPNYTPQFSLLTGSNFSQILRGACGGWWYAPSSSPHYQGKGWEVYTYLAWTSLLLMVKRSLHRGCGALNARALLVTYIFGATILLASAIISCGLLIPVFLLPLSFNRANSEQIYWPAVAWGLLGWNMFLNVSFTIYLKSYYL